MTHTYESFKERLGKEESHYLDLHTYLLKGEGDDLIIRVGSVIETNICTYKPTGEIIIRAGGIRSSHHRKMINCFIPFFDLIAKDNFWFWIEKDDKEEKPIALFTEEDIIHADGRLDFKRGVGDALKLIEYKAKVTEYALLYAQSAPVPHPSSQDCWNCFIYGFGTQPIGQEEIAHIKDHIDNKKIMPSLLRNALAACGNTQLTKYVYANYQGKISAEQREEVSKVVRKYLIKALGLPTMSSVVSK